MPKARILTRSTEEKISAALSSALDRISDGEPPPAALEKVAKEADLTADQIRMVCRAYNTGVSVYQISSGSNVMEKAAAPKLVDPEAIISRVFSSRSEPPVKTAIDYSLPPSTLLAQPKRDSWFAKLSFTTTSAKPVRDTVTEWKEKKRIAVDSAAYVKHSNAHKYAQATAKLREYFRTHGAIAPDEVLENCVAKLGQSCVPIIKEAAAGSSVNPHVVRNRPVDWDKPPYSWVTEAVNYAVKVAIADNVVAKVSKDETGNNLRKLRELRSPIFGSVIDYMRNNSCLTDAAIKEAALLSPISDAGTEVSKALGTTLAGKDISMTDAIATDPSLGLRTTTAKVKGVLAALSREDPVISEYGSNEITNAYNHLSRLAPRAMQNPAVITMYLRKMLSAGGVLDPFDAEQLTRIEKQLEASASRLEDRLLRPGKPPSGKGGGADA